MGNAKLKYLLIVVLLLMVVISAIFALTFSLMPVASASDLPHFVIHTDDGVVWQLYRDGNFLVEYDGCFFEQFNPNAVTVKMYQAIREQLILDGVIDSDTPQTSALFEHYTLEFDLPDTTTTLYGTDTTTYTQLDDSPIVLMCNEQANIILSAPYVSVQYRPVGSEDFEYCNTDKVGSGYRFGQNIAVGDYEVRLVVVETFEFDGATRTAMHYGNTVLCHILAGEAIAPENATAVVVYGTNASGIANYIDAEYDQLIGGGTWRLSQTQSNAIFDDVDDKNGLYLTVGEYTLQYDFYPYNANYLPALSVNVEVNITKKAVIIYIDSAYSLVGEDLVDITTLGYRVEEDMLVGNDTVEGLGISLSCPELTNEVAGLYVVVATFENENYIADCRGYSSAFISGGRYDVYSKTYVVYSSDGVKFEIFCNEGFISKTPVITTFDSDDVYGDKICVKAYSIKFVDENRNAVIPPETYTVVWTAKDDAQYYMSGSDDTIYDITGECSLTFDRQITNTGVEGDSILLLADTTVALTLTRGHIALIVVDCVLVVCIVCVVIAYTRRRRYLA